MEGTQGVQIPVKGLILRVPFQIEGHPALYVVDLVAVDEVFDHARRAFRPLHFLDLPVGKEQLVIFLHPHQQIALNPRLDPARRPQGAGKLLRHVRFVPAWRSNVPRGDAESE